MPLYAHSVLPDGSTLAIWKIEEDENYFERLIDFTETDRTELGNIHVAEKRLQWLASRLCAKLIILAPHAVEMQKQQSGKPQLMNVEGHLSISHTTQYVAALYNSKLYVGVDVEEISPRVRSIQHKFLSTEELQRIPANQPDTYLCLMWSLKETLFKVFPLSGIEFKSQISVAPFDVKEEGDVICAVHKDDLQLAYTCHYRFFDGHCITYTSHA